MTHKPIAYSWDVYVSNDCRGCSLLRVGRVSSCVSEATARLEALYWFATPGNRPAHTTDSDTKLIYEDDTLIVRKVG